MAFIRKSSQPRKTQLATSLPAIPPSVPPELRDWFNDIKGAIDEDRETIEAAFADRTRSIESLSMTISALQARLEAIESTTQTDGKITDGDVAHNAAIKESKLALSFPTHSSGNDPTPGQKAALAGTYGMPSAVNRYVTNADPRLEDSSETNPPGVVRAYLGTDTPEGWLEADGSAVDRFSYANLFAVIGTTWGVGDGSTTFNLPDFRGRALIGAGTGGGLTARALGEQTIGAETVTLTADQSGLRSHGHDVVTQGAALGVVGIAGSDGTGANTMQSTEFVPAADAIDAHENCQPSAVVRWIVKT